MDLSAIKAVEKTLDILHPATDEPTGLSFVVVPQSDERVQAVRRKFQNQQLAKRNAKLNAEQAETFNKSMRAASVVGIKWKGEASFKGEQLKYTPENVELLLAETWIAEQLDAELEDTAGFFTV